MKIRPANPAVGNVKKLDGSEWSRICTKNWNRCGSRSSSAIGERSLVRFLVMFWKTHSRGKRTGNGKCLMDWGKSGGRGRDRTYDQSIKSRMLYQLSYASLSFAPEEGDR